MFQAIISKSLMEISQEKCNHVSTYDSDDSDYSELKEDLDEEKKKNETGKWNSKSSIFSKGTRKGGLATLFR